MFSKGTAPIYSASILKYLYISAFYFLSSFNSSYNSRTNFSLYYKVVDRLSFFSSFLSCSSLKTITFYSSASNCSCNVRFCIYKLSTSFCRVLIYSPVRSLAVIFSSCISRYSFSIKFTCRRHLLNSFRHDAQLGQSP